MLKLRKVELVGFKSFLEKTHLTFSGNGLSCIIGPNGCGKSNIVDAVSWVLGEQSHKNLRAERMADCIFNGTARRPPMGMAEVKLTLVDDELANAAKFVFAQPESDAPSATPDEATAGASADSAPDATSQEIVISENANAAADDAKPFRKKRGAQKPDANNRPGEVVIGRRLYRSGQSEYLINGRSARLRDIQELFMGIGLGPDSYAIIEQGRIGQVLSSKPSDRRAIIEEAAGITKYKTKKRLAEAKLESSKVNLSRVNDIYVEVEKQLASLKRQASKARRYAEMRDQMRSLLRQVLANKAHRIDSETERLAGLLAEITTSETQMVQSITGMESEQQLLDRRADELDTELRQNQNWIGQAKLELDRAENRIIFNKQRSEQLRLREQELDGEVQQAAALMAQLEAQGTAQAGVVSKLREETAALEATLAVLANASAQLAGSSQEAESRIAGLHRQIAELDAALRQLQNTQAQAEQSVAHHSGALERLEASEHQLLEESLYHREKSRMAEIRWQQVNDQAREIDQSLLEAQANLAEIRGQQQQTAARAEVLRGEVAGTRARRETLEQILNDRSYTAEAVQKLFAARGEEGTRDFRAVGVLADYAEVQPEHEGAVEQFLRDELQYVVVETFDHARAGIALLREDVGGRATFFVDSLRNLGIPIKEQEHNPIADQPGMVSRLDRLVEFRDPLGPAAKQFLPRLQSAFLVESAEAAERFSAENPAYSFLTPEGTCYQGRAVTGGRPSDAGPLVMKRELRNLEVEGLRLENESNELRSALEAIVADRSRSEATVASLTAEQVKAGKSVVSATMERDLSRAELARLGGELSTCQNDIARLRTESQAAQQRAQQAIAGREETTRAREQAAQEASQATAQIADLQRQAQVQHEDLASRRAEKAALDERLASASAIATRLDKERREVQQRAAALDGQRAAITTEQQQLAQQNEDQQRQIEVQRAECVRLEARQIELQQEWEAARRRATEVDDVLRMSRQKLADLREQRATHEVERARNDSEREHLRETCLNELNAQIEDLIAEQPNLLAAEELAAADTQYHEMKSRIESMGPINMMALEEYNECEQRFGFLGRERADLLQSITDTQQAIGELDLVSRQKFEEAFNVINTHFATAFQTLFGGGTGQMRLSEPDSAGDAGIDIAAQPPGKKLQNVLLLSGGEKALTALALLIAIFRYQPSPFCILDEVDAPLDETNVGRFAQMVAEMSAEAQFIVVTHNRRTMEMASVLYGVTMQEPGVSKLVSVNWDRERAEAATAAA